MNSEIDLQKLHEAIALIRPGNVDTLIRFEVAPSLARQLKEKLSSTLYTPPSPNSTLAAFMGIQVWCDAELPDGVIVFIYKTPDGERREARILNLEGK